MDAEVEPPEGPGCVCRPYSSCPRIGFPARLSQSAAVDSNLADLVMWTCLGLGLFALALIGTVLFRYLEWQPRLEALAELGFRKGPWQLGGHYRFVREDEQGRSCYAIRSRQKGSVGMPGAVAPINMPVYERLFEYEFEPVSPLTLALSARSTTSDGAPYLLTGATADVQRRLIEAGLEAKLNQVASDLEIVQLILTDTCLRLVTPTDIDVEGVERRFVTMRDVFRFVRTTLGSAA